MACRARDRNRTDRASRGAAVCGWAGRLVGAWVAIPQDGFAAFLVAALEVLLGHRLLVGEDAVVVLLGGFGAGEDDELRHPLELFGDERGVRAAALPEPDGFHLDMIE